MADNTAIEWTDATVNKWWGCSEVGPGCDHCYAREIAKRFGHNIWGAGVDRLKIKSASAALAKLNKQGGKWVFIQSMSDLFDNEVPIEWLAEAWADIQAATNCKIQILTKRISIVEKRLATIGATWPSHAGIMISVVNQQEADRDIPRLLALKAKLGIPWVGLSMEPLLGPVDLMATDYLTTKLGAYPFKGVASEDRTKLLELIDWVIVGGESGQHARPMHPDWARSIRDQCAAAGTAFFFKQWGEWGPADDLGEEVDGVRFGCFNDAGQWVQPVSQDVASRSRFTMFRLGKKQNGALLDGREHKEFPNVPRP